MAAAPSETPPETGAREGGISRSLFTRLAVAAVLAALAGMLALYLVTAWTLERAQKDALEASVATDLAGLADIYASGGREELVRRIGDRLALLPPEGPRSHYLLADESGTPIAGDIARWPLLSAENSESGFVDLDGGVHAFAQATQLAPGLRLVVARDSAAGRALLDRLRWSFLATALAVLALVAGAAILAARRLRARVAALNRAYRGYESGRLMPEPRASYPPDEIGELARHTDAALVRLSALASAQRAMSDNVAHEIRTPLMHLDTLVLRELENREDSDLTERLDAVRGEIAGTIAMLDALLDIAASEAKRGDRFGLETVDLSALARGLAELYADSAEEVGLEFRAEIAPNVTMRAEPMLVSRMLTNLLDNAFKYVPRGGTVTLSVEPGPRIAVADDGLGIPEAARGRIFDRFQRAGAVQEGHGLGLALARAIAERHDLSLTLADSEKGALFVISPKEAV